MQQIWKTQQWLQDWKISVFIPIPKKGNAKKFSNYHKIALISHASVVMLKILQTRLQQYMNCALADVQAGFWKGRGNKQKNSRKSSTSDLLTMPKLLTGWITTNCGKFFKRWEYQTALPASYEICMQVKKQQLKPDMEQWTGCKLGEKYVKAIYCHSAYLTYMQSVSCEMPSWMNLKLESRLLGEMSITSDMQMISPQWQKVKKN